MVAEVIPIQQETTLLHQEIILHREVAVLHLQEAIQHQAEVQVEVLVAAATEEDAQAVVLAEEDAQVAEDEDVN